MLAPSSPAHYPAPGLGIPSDLAPFISFQNQAVKLEVGSGALINIKNAKLINIYIYLHKIFIGS